MEVFDRFTAALQNPGEFKATMAKLRESRTGESFDTFRLPDGRCFEVVSKAKHIDNLEAGRVWSFRDVTRREQAAEQIRQRIVAR